MASATEQVLAAGVSAGIGLEDDSNLTKVYLPQNPDLVFQQSSTAVTTAAADEPKLKLVARAMAGVHLVAAAEAMTLGAKVGLDTTQLQEIIATAAGTSWMFVDRSPQMLSGTWQSTKTVEEVISELVRLPFNFLLFLSCDNDSYLPSILYPLQLTGADFPRSRRRWRRLAG
jgi:3-hydroxyisobutyrate dehydrogenase